MQDDQQYKRICPHDETHDRNRRVSGYVRDGWDEHHSVCIECFCEHPDRKRGRFHSPHGSYANLKFLDITELGMWGYNKHSYHLFDGRQISFLIWKDNFQQKNAFKTLSKIDKEILLSALDKLEKFNDTCRSLD